MCEATEVEIRLSPSEVIQRITDFIYKPGCGFSAGYNDFSFHISLNMYDQPDATDPSKRTSLTFTQAYTLDEIQTWGQLKEVMLHFLIKWETHEMKEWFRYKSRMNVFPPHPFV